MTEAHDNAQDARELLAAIDAWQAADAAVKEADKLIRAALPEDEEAAWGVRSKAVDVLYDASEWHTHKPFTYQADDALAAFTTLAAHIRTLEAERDAAVAKIERAMAIPAADTGYGLTDEAANDMRDEFRRALTGEA